MSKRVLDLSDSSDEEPNQLNLNSDFAKNYDNWRRKEEIQKLKDKYGNNLDVLSDSDQTFVSGSDDVSDDSDVESDESVGGEQEVFDDNFFKVYSALKTKNSVIYDKNIRFFDEIKTESQTEDNSNEDIVDKNNEKRLEKRMTLKDYHKKLIKEKKGVTEEDQQMERLSNRFEDKPIGYYEELDQIRNEFKSVLNSDESDGESGEELIKGKSQPIRQLKDKTLDFLDETNGQNNDSDLKYLRNYWKSNNELEESEQFLRDYIINKRYVNKKDEELYRIPDLTETQISDNESRGRDEDNNKFETIEDMNKVNENELKISKFHFEEPNAVSLKRYPRSVDTIRDSTKEEKRAEKRTETKERKRREKERELKRLRRLKREELRQRLAKMQEISGNEKIDLNDLDLNTLLDDENDFDSEKYDTKMSILFGDQYYGNQLSNKSKPKFEYMPEIDDFDYSQQLDDNEDNTWNNSKNSKKLNKKQKKISKSLDEIGIYEDLIGGEIATRYKYRTVEANDFGLTDEEIMFSEDKELNKWCSIKKMSQYRDDNEERYDVKSYANKAMNSELKRKVLQSYYEKQNESKNEEQIDSELNSNSNNDNNIKKRKKRKHKKPEFTVEPIGDKNKQQNRDNVLKNNSNSDKKKRFRKNRNNRSKSSENPYPGITIDRLKAYGLSNRRIKRIKNKK